MSTGERGKVLVCLAVAKAIKDPLYRSNAYIVSILRESLLQQDGWIHCEMYLLYGGVYGAVNKAIGSSRESSLKVGLYLREALKLLDDSADYNDDSVEFVEAKNILEVKIHDNIVYIRRRYTLSAEELALLDALPELKTIGPAIMVQMVYISAVDNKFRLIDVPIPGRTSILGALDEIIKQITLSKTITCTPEIYYKNRGRNKEGVADPRIFSACISSHTDNSLPVNRIASWIACTQVYGDAIVADLTIQSCKGVSTDFFKSILSSSLPSGIWFSPDVDRQMLLCNPLIFPTKYVHEMWFVSKDKNAGYIPLSRHAPLSLLDEIAGRIVGGTANVKVVKTKLKDAIVSGDDVAIQMNERLQEICSFAATVSEEPVPSSNEWEAGVLPAAIKPKKQVVNMNNMLESVVYVRISIPRKVFGLDYGDDGYLHYSAHVSGSSFGCDNNQVVQYITQFLAFQYLQVYQARGLHQLGIDDHYPAIESKYFGCMTSSQTQIDMSIWVANESARYISYAQSGLLPLSIEAKLEEALVENMKICISLVSAEDEMLSAISYSTACSGTRKEHRTELTLQCKVLAAESNRKAELKKKRMISLFNPTLSFQRKNLVTSLIRASAATSLLDVGCGDGTLLTHCLSCAKGQQGYVETLQTIAGIDISDKNLMRVGRVVDTIKYDYDHAINLSLFLGCAITSSFEPLKRINTSWDVVTCIEVIEHLPTLNDAITMVARLLNELTPKYLVITTPNYDSNDVIKALESRFYMDPNEASNAFQCRMASNGRYFREEDHKFELTRQEFAAWIDAVLELVHALYRTETVYLGNSLDERIDCGQRVDGATQVVVFIRESMRDHAPVYGTCGPDIQLIQSVQIVKNV